jgi:predicted nucleotidyltransferase
MTPITLIKPKKVDDALISTIAKRIKEAVKPLKIILFGSYATGKANADSDIDILIVAGKSGISKNHIASKAYGALAGVLIPKDIVVCTEKEIKDWSNVPQAFVTTAIAEGKVIYEK